MRYSMGLSGCLRVDFIGRNTPLLPRETHLLVRQLVRQALSSHYAIQAYRRRPAKQIPNPMLYSSAPSGLRIKHAVDLLHTIDVDAELGHAIHLRIV